MQVPWERKYLAGWGYLLSRDVAQHVVNATSAWERAPGQAPGWYAGLHWEDVLIGLIASEFTGEEPQVRCVQVGASCSQHIKLVFTPWSIFRSSKHWQKGGLLQDDPAFVAAWKGCSAATAVRHLDVEAPQLFRPLHQMELRGAWQGDQVPACPFSHTARASSLPARTLSAHSFA